MADVVLTSTETKYFTDDDVSKTVSRAIDLLNYDFNHDFHFVVIKPSLCYYWDYSTSETTDPRVVSAIVDYVRGQLGNDVSIFVAEADASAMRTKHAFKMLGYEKLSRKKHVKLVNLSKGDIVDKEVSVGDKKFTLKVNKMLLESKLIINVPKLKYHRRVGISCALKNMFGAISTPGKYIYHRELSEVIVGINKIVNSDVTVVDGIIAKGKYPKKMGVIIVSDNVLAADYAAAKILGYNPRRIAHINLAEKEKIGDFNHINLVEDGTDLEEIRSAFPEQNYLLQKISWKLQLKMLKAYSKIVGDTIPPILEE